MNDSLTVNVLKSKQAFCEPQPKLVFMEATALQQALPNVETQAANTTAKGVDYIASRQTSVEPYLLLLQQTVEIPICTVFMHHVDGVATIDPRVVMWNNKWMEEVLGWRQTPTLAGRHRT